MNPLDMPLDDFCKLLPIRPRNCIKANVCFDWGTEPHMKPPFTVRHLMMCSRKEMRRWPNLGKKSMNEIEELLREHGLQLWEEHDSRSLAPLIDYFRKPRFEDQLEVQGKVLRVITEESIKKGAVLRQALEALENCMYPQFKQAQAIEAIKEVL